MMSSIRNQKGIALISTLLLVVLGFGVVAIMFRLSTQSSKLAGLEQGYAASLDAAKSGADLFIYMVQNGTYNPPNASFGTSSGKCLGVKMFNTTSSWQASANWTGCASAVSTTYPSAISSDPQDHPDLTLNLTNGSIQYTVNVKVIDNYASSATLTTPCYNGCYYYTVISRAQPVGSKESAEIYFVYRYPQ
jgi:Tfp pilus assembly protein PilX